MKNKINQPDCVGSKMVDSMPSVQYKQKTGEWIINSDGYYPYCSMCRKEPQGRIMTDYCPNCGTKMGAISVIPITITVKDNEVLKPCPFCGEEAELQYGGNGNRESADCHSSDVRNVGNWSEV